MSDGPVPGATGWVACLAVGLGGGAGSVCRYLLGLWTPKVLGLSLTGTLIANLVGTALVGLFMGLMLRTIPPGQSPLLGETARLLFVTGFCGGLTTFSTLMFEADGLLRLQRADAAFAYMAVTLVVGLLAVRLGWLLASGWPVRA